jgi:hypothetical protein
MTGQAGSPPPNFKGMNLTWTKTGRFPPTAAFQPVFNAVFGLANFLALKRIYYTIKDTIITIFDLLNHYGG